MLLHIAAIQLDTDSNKESPWHSLTPALRLFCIVISVFATALTTNGHWWTWLIYSMGIWTLIIFSRVTILELIKRVAIESAFIGLIILGTLFQSDGTVIWQWGLLKITDLGLIILASVSCKVFLSLFMLNILIITTPIPDLFNALLFWKMPPLLVAIMTSMYRYLGVLITEFKTMYRAAIARNLLINPYSHRLIIGNMIGVLFIRTYERGEKVYQSMLARGYQGFLTLDSQIILTKTDFLIMTLIIMFLLFGQLVYCL